MKSPCATLESSPRSPQREKSPHSNEDPTQSKINQKTLNTNIEHMNELLNKLYPG